MGAEPPLARRFVSTGPEVTEALGERIAALLEAGDVLALDGELGTGKTTFVRGLARGLGVTEAVSSPTFTLMNTYAGRLPVHHLDAWMAERGDAFLSEGGAEWLGGDGVAVVEWAERVEAWLPAGCLWVRLFHLEDSGGLAESRRGVTLEIPGPAGRGLAGRLEALRPPPGLEDSD